METLNKCVYVFLKALDENESKLLEDTCFVDCSTDFANEADRFDDGGLANSIETKEIKSKKLLKIIDYLIDSLLSQGWIYPSVATIGSMSAYHVSIWFIVFSLQGCNFIIYEALILIKK